MQKRPVTCGMSRLLDDKAKQINLSTCAEVSHGRDRVCFSPYPPPNSHSGAEQHYGSGPSLLISLTRNFLLARRCTIFSYTQWWNKQLFLLIFSCPGFFFPSSLENISKYRIPLIFWCVLPDCFPRKRTPEHPYSAEKELGMTQEDNLSSPFEWNLHCIYFVCLLAYF